MPLRDLLMQMNSYPESTPDWALEGAAALARSFGAKLSIGVCKVHIPPVSNWLANKLINADGMIAAENQRSAENAKELLKHFEATIDDSIKGEALLIECPGMVTHWQLASRARAYDLLVVPVYGHDQTVSMVEGLAFDTGRPVLLLTKENATGAFDDVVVGWDGSRAAARALADALCICGEAKTVKIAVVSGEKDLSPGTPVADVLRHLKRHGIAAEAIEVMAEGRNAGEALQAYALEAGSDLLVMGAYGHSRVREFVLGGATRSVLEKPSLPIFLSH